MWLLLRDFQYHFPTRKMWPLLRFPLSFPSQKDVITLEISVILFLPERCDYSWDFRDPFPARKMWLLLRNFRDHFPVRKQRGQKSLFTTIPIHRSVVWYSTSSKTRPFWPLCQKDVITLEISVALSLSKRCDYSCQSWGFHDPFSNVLWELASKQSFAASQHREHASASNQMSDNRELYLKITWHIKILVSSLWKLHLLMIFTLKS